MIPEHIFKRMIIFALLMRKHFLNREPKMTGTAQKGHGSGDLLLTFLDGGRYGIKNEL
jgi:hypothetical protein